MGAKVDFKRQIEAYRAPRGRVQRIAVPALQYLMIDGHGDPNTSPRFAQGIGALFPLAYKLKFHSKNELRRDYVVMPLEGLWWAEDMGAFTVRRDKSQWLWTLMTMVPDWIDASLLDLARQQIGASGASPLLDQVRLERLEEGTCLQTLHVGSFDDEGGVMGQLHAHAADAGLRLTGRHHEIYLSDIRRSAPDKLRTILRQPVTGT
ncbi:GyrI-like domain-containing protein [Glutamicibacter creatinolyticus]|uniref:GyrI-like domain-containing protein n=1 Tax=Glutamicibacter creatinolyticus TaxID=162496 RepID=UPI003B97D357